MPVPLDNVFAAALAFRGRQLLEQSTVVEDGRGIDSVVVRHDQWRLAVPVRRDERLHHRRRDKRHVRENDYGRRSRAVGCRLDAHTERAVYAARILRVEDRPMRDAGQRLLDSLRLVTEYDDQRIESRRGRAFDHAPDERLTVDGHEQLVLPHARGRPRREDDARHCCRTFSQHGSCPAFPAGG